MSVVTEPSVRLKVELENAYSDGHESKTTEWVEIPPFADVEEMWEHLQDFTGDGHGAGEDLGYCYTVTVLEAPGRAELVGLSNEWAGK